MTRKIILSSAILDGGSRWYGYEAVVSPKPFSKEREVIAQEFGFSTPERAIARANDALSLYAMTA